MARRLQRIEGWLYSGRCSTFSSSAEQYPNLMCQSSRWPRMLTTSAGDIWTSDLPKLLKEISPTLHPFVKFLYATGLRSGQAKDLTRKMVDKNCTELHEPGELTQDGEPIFDFVQDIKNMLRLNRQPIFHRTNF